MGFVDRRPALVLSRLLLAVMVVAFGAGCAATPEPAMSTPTDAGDAVACCANPEQFPPWLAKSADLSAPIIGRGIGRIRFRRGYLANQDDAQGLIRSKLRPLDLVIVQSDGRMSHRLIPGAFGHVSIYLGDERALRRLGIWDAEEVAPYHDQLRAGAILIESDSKGVHLSPPSVVLNADSVVVLRPKLSSTARKREAGRAFFAHLGEPFDFHFNAGEDRWLFCAELVNHVIPELGIPLRRVYGRMTILPDEVIAKTLTGETRLSLVAYVRGWPDRWEIGTDQDLARALRAAWRPRETGAPSRQDASGVQ